MARAPLSDAELLAQIPAARARDAQDRKQGRRAVSARYDRRAERVVLELTNGFLFAFPVRAIPELRVATRGRQFEHDQVTITEQGRGSAVRAWKTTERDVAFLDWRHVHIRVHWDRAGTFRPYIVAGLEALVVLLEFAVSLL